MATIAQVQAVLAALQNVQASKDPGQPIDPKIAQYEERLATLMLLENHQSSYDKDGFLTYEAMLKRMPPDDENGTI